jgi:hypothetical protein
MAMRYATGKFMGNQPGLGLDTLDLKLKSANFYHGVPQSFFTEVTELSKRNFEFGPYGPRAQSIGLIWVCTLL